MKSKNSGLRRILHVEVGGPYGGSVRALELYLKHCDRSHYEHDLLLYHPTAGIEEITPRVNRISILCRGWSASVVPVPKSKMRRGLGFLLDRLGLTSAAMQMWAVCRIVVNVPVMFRLV